MEGLMTGLRWMHIIAGFGGLAAFWVPIFARKGGANHRLFGKIFKYCAYIVLIGAMVSVALHLGTAMAEGEGPRTSPSGFAFLVFLGYLALVTFIGLRHGIGVLQNKVNITDMNRMTNTLFAWAAIASSVGLIVYTLYYTPPIKVVLFALSPIGFGTGFGILKAIQGRRPEKKAWFYEHMGAMIGTGIAFHTAFAVFGSGQLFNLGLQGWTAVIPWITPALIGIPGSIIWTKYYQRKFNDFPASKSAATTSGPAA